MNIITDGLGSKSIVTRGYGGFWAKVKKIIEEGLSRMIPKERRKLLMRVPVLGDVIGPYQQTIQVTGKKDFFRVLWTLLEDEEED